MKPRRIHHIGVVVPTVERVHEILDLWGLEIGKTDWIEAYKADCFFTKHGPDDRPIEFIVPRQGVLTKFNDGKGGIHHIAFEVDDVEATREELEAKGRKMLEEHAHRGNAGLWVNFLRPSYGYGILVEFVQPENEEVRNAF